MVESVVDLALSLNCLSTRIFELIDVVGGQLVPIWFDIDVFPIFVTVDILIFLQSDANRILLVTAVE